TTSRTLDRSIGNRDIPASFPNCGKGLSLLPWIDARPRKPAIKRIVVYNRLSARHGRDGTE
ncbi:MAG TPA: hypothetical protein VMV69_17225, partial [Pirellulales bacterium]|nr:hypothetical protein [Pirellulales bacterium]